MSPRKWNPVIGCQRVGPGCVNCWAERQAALLRRRDPRYGSVVTAGGRWEGWIRTVPDVIAAPLSWAVPSRIVVSDMGDLFHGDVTDDWLDLVFAVMGLAKQHTFELCTKFPQRMLDYVSRPRREDAINAAAMRHFRRTVFASQSYGMVPGPGWPLPNVWLGTSAENQEAAERCRVLAVTPAAVRFLVLRPLLGPVDLVRCGAILQTDYGDLRDGGFVPGPRCMPMIEQVRVGGEWGPHARSCDLAWLRLVVGQCAAARLPCWVEGIGRCPVTQDRAEAAGRWHRRTDGDGLLMQALRIARGGWPYRIHDRRGADPFEWPEDLRVRQEPA